MRQAKRVRNLGVASILATIAVMFIAGANSNDEIKPRLDAQVMLAGNAFVLQVTDHATNKLHLYKRMNEDAFEFQETIDLSAVGARQIAVERAAEEPEQ